MTPAVRAVFVFDQDGDVMAFPSVEDAAGEMEAVDVDAGEYAALYALDGRIVTATIDAERVMVILTVEEQRDEAGLRQRLLDARERVGLTSPPDDLAAIANELLRLEWEHRWPKWPRWLARRLHGQGPHAV
jgi:hypothetical protein